MIQIFQSPEPVMVPPDNCPWAETAVLNPAVVKDPETGQLHMLFRATGPFPEKQKPGKCLPYPIFLGYAVSNDNGESWTPDFSKPALAPALKEDIDDIYITNINGDKQINYTNGCIEDPRIFPVENDYYLSAACRMFPPGPFWEKDDPLRLVPKWVNNKQHPFGRAASENVTVTVLYKLRLNKLRKKKYNEAFEYIGNITDPQLGENRDVFLFPEKMKIYNLQRYALLLRPEEGEHFSENKKNIRPSIWTAYAENICDFGTSKNIYNLLAEPLFDWELDKIGTSWPPIKLDNGEWLLPYHGKKDMETGYTQSFMILNNRPDGILQIKHRCPDRLMYAKYEWERGGLFPAPCIFTTAGLVIDENLVMWYGAADKKIGTAKTNFNELIDYIRKFDMYGRKKERKKELNPLRWNFFNYGLHGLTIIYCYYYYFIFIILIICG